MTPAGSLTRTVSAIWVHCIDLVFQIPHSFCQVEDGNMQILKGWNFPLDTLSRFPGGAECQNYAISFDEDIISSVITKVCQMLYWWMEN